MTVNAVVPLHPTDQYLAFEWLRNLANGGVHEAGIAFDEWTRLHQAEQDTLTQQVDLAPMFWMWRHLNKNIKQVYLRTATSLNGDQCRELANKEWTELPDDVRRAVMDQAVHAAVCMAKKVLEEKGVW